MVGSRCVRAVRGRGGFSEMAGLLLLSESKGSPDGGHLIKQADKVVP